MANALKLSIGVNIDAAGAKSGGASAQAAVAAIGGEAQRSAAKLQQLIDRHQGLTAAVANTNIRDRGADISAYGAELDRLRAKYNPLFAVIRQYKETVAEIRTVHAQGAISTNEMAAAISRHRQATLASIDAIKGRNAALREPVVPTDNAPLSAQSFYTANIAAQFQDIAVTSAMGMSPLQIGLQQGTQLASVVSSMERPVQGLTAAFTSLVSPVSLFTIGAVAASAAAIQWLTSSGKEAKTLKEVLDEQAKALSRVRDLWGEAAEQRSRYGRDTTAGATFNLETNISTLTKRLREGVTDGSIGSAITSAINSNRELSGFSAPEFRNTALFKALQIDLNSLHREALRGSPIVLRLIQNLEEIGRASDNSGLRAMAAEAVSALQPFKDLAEAIRDAEVERRRLFSDRGPNGRLLSRGTTNLTDMGDLAIYESRQRVQLERNRRAAEADLVALNARSPSERSAAARQQAASEYRDESPAERRQRIDLAGNRALAQAEKELSEAQRDRLRSLNETMESQRLDLALIGQTVSETERLRMEQRLTAELKADAASKGVEVDQAELDLIRQKSAEYGRLAEKIAATNLLRDQADTVLQLQTELSLVGANDEVRRRTLTQLQAEQQLRQRGISLGSAEAEQYRRQAAAMSEVTNELRKQNEAWSQVRGAGEDAIDGIVDSLLSGDIKDGLADVAKDISKTFIELGVTNPLKNAALGTDYATGSDLKSVFSRLFGGGDAANPISQAVSAMNVSAGTVMINGSATTGLGLLGNAANDNNVSIPGTGSGVGGSFLTSFLGSGKSSTHVSGMSGDLQTGLTAMLKAAPAGIADDITINSGFRSVARQRELFDAAVAKYGSVAAARRWVAPPGNSQHNLGNAADLGFGSSAARNWAHENAGQFGLRFPMAHEPWHIETAGARSESAAQALEKLAGSAGKTADNLGTLGNGFDKFGNALAGAASGGGGGLLSGLSQIGLSIFAQSGQFASAMLSGGIGLYANGGISDRPAIFGEGPYAEAAVPLPNGRSIPVDMRVRQVIPQSAANSAGAMGGGARPNITIVNNSSARVSGEMQETTDERGGRQFTFVMEDEVAGAVSRPGSKADRAIRSGYGLRKRTARR